MRRVMIVFPLLMILAILSGCGKDRSFTIDKVEIRAQIMEDGDLYVEELYTYQFKGEFNGTTRSLGSKGHDGVEFFEAYLPPADPKLGSFSYEDSVQLRTELSDNTYRIHTKSRDEIKQVYYRYRMDHAARKYLDTAELYWAFFDSDNETDLYDLSIEILLPQSLEAGEVDYYLHDRSGGLISEVSGRSIRYHTELMPAGQKSEFRLLFPAEWMPDSPLTAKENRKAAIHAEEHKLGIRYDQREEKLAQAEKVINGVSGLILVAILYFAFLSPYKLARLTGRHISWDELEALDPLFVAYIYRKGKLIQKDITAGLFSLYQKGWLEISKIPANLQSRQDPKAPNETLRFTFVGDMSLLHDYESHFVDWLFKQVRGGGKKRSFTLESISGPTPEERKESKNVEAYNKRKKRFEVRFETWKAKVMRHEPFSPFYKDNSAIAWVVPTLTIILYAVVIYLYYVDVSSWTAMGWAAAILGAFAIAVIWRLRSTVTFILYCIFCFIVVVQITFTDAIFVFVGTILLSMIIRFLLPARVPTSQGAPYRWGIVKWRRSLKRRSYPAGNEPSKLERLMQYALILGVSQPFAKHHATSATYDELQKTFPLIAIPHETSSIFNYTYHSWNVWGSSDSSGGGSSSSGGGSSSSSGGGGGAGAF